MVELEAVESDEDIQELRSMIERHAEFTQSKKAKAILANWSSYLPKFIKVMPTDYKRVLEEQRAASLAPVASAS
jgi:glutamate synthase domain-containing protein 3